MAKKLPTHKELSWAVCGDIRMPDLPHQDGWLVGIEEISQRLGCSKPTVRRLINRREIYAVKYLGKWYSNTAWCGFKGIFYKNGSNDGPSNKYDFEGFKPLPARTL